MAFNGNKLSETDFICCQHVGQVKLEAFKFAPGQLVIVLFAKSPSARGPFVTPACRVTQVAKNIFICHICANVYQEDQAVLNILVRI